MIIKYDVIFGFLLICPLFGSFQSIKNSIPFMFEIIFMSFMLQKSKTELRCLKRNSYGISLRICAVFDEISILAKKITDIYKIVGHKHQ